MNASTIKDLCHTITFFAFLHVIGLFALSDAAQRPDHPLSGKRNANPGFGFNGGFNLGGGVNIGPDQNANSGFGFNGGLNLGGGVNLGK